MLSGHRSAWRRRGNSRAVRIAVPLAIPMALGLTLGIILAVSGGNTTTIEQSALGACSSATASASGAAPAASGSQAATAAGASAPAAAASTPAPAASALASAPASAAATPCPSASGSAAAPAAVAAAVTGIPPINPPGRAGLAGSNAVDAAGNAFSFTQTQAQAADSTNCTVTVPDRPLSAKGLATPWELGDGCTWANGATEGVFIDATILAPNGQLQVYNPLVINQGTTPAVAPTPPTIARGSQVILSAGFNGNALALVGRGARQGNCIDAYGNSLMNQTPQCNAAHFYRMANFEIAHGPEPDQPERVELVAGAERTVRPAEPEGNGRAAPGRQPATAGRRAVQPGQDQRLPDGDRPASAGAQHQPRPERGAVLPEHDQ